MSKYSKMSDKINEFETIMDSFYRRDPVEEANTSARRAVDDFNAWVKTINAELEAEHLALQRQLEPARQIEAQIASINHRLEQETPDPRNPTLIKAYNRLVGEYNALVQKHKELVQTYKQNEQVYRDKVDEVNREMTLRREIAEVSEKDAEEQFKTYQRWGEERGPERFFNELNRFYASLQQEARRTGKSSGELEQYIDKVREIRSEIGDHARKQQQMAENGLLIVQSTLCRSEKCYLIIDIAASFVSITPELVDAIGIGEHVGEEVELSLPAGIRIRAPQLLIPSISVYGMEAEYVKAVVLKESMPGVDGCLGLSFLNRFDYTIERGISPKLLLKMDRKTEATALFDVFICHAAKDLSFAREVFDALTESGYQPFLSEVSAGRGTKTDYQKTTDTALESAMHLVVVCSSGESVKAPWVEAEWRLFDALKRSGKKQGNIIPILCGDMTIDELPMALNRYQVISSKDQNWRKTLINYLTCY